MQGCIYHDYLMRFGGPAGAFGYPTSNETGTKGGGGRVNYMSGTACGSSHGSGLFWSSAIGTWPVHGCTFQKYEAISEDGSGLGNQNNYTNQWANFGAVCSSDGTATIVLADGGGDTYPAEVGADAIRAVRTGIVC